MTLFGIILYLTAQLALCYWVSRKISDESDYLIAGRSLGLGLATFSIFATWYGAETCVGSSAAIFGTGLYEARGEPFGYTICLVLMAILLAGQLWRRKYITLADLYRDKFDRSTEWLAVLILIPSTLMWAAAQVRAFGMVLSTSGDMNLDLAIFISAAFVVAYTFYGGLLGDVYTDVIQGAVLVLGIIAVTYFVITDNGGFFELWSKVEPERLSLVAPGSTWLERADRWAIPIFGSLITQEVISRMLGSKSATIAVRATLFAAGMYLILGLLPIFLGLVGPHLGIEVVEEDLFLPTLARETLPPLLFVIFSGAILSAILSTADSTLLTAGGLLAHNLLIPAAGVSDEKQKVRLVRMVVVVSGVFAYWIAQHTEGIYDLVEYASEFGAAGLLVITIAGLWGKRHSPMAANVCLVVGVLATPVFEHFGVTAPFLATIASSCGAYLLLNAILPASSEPAAA